MAVWARGADSALLRLRESLQDVLGKVGYNHARVQISVLVNALGVQGHVHELSVRSTGPVSVVADRVRKQIDARMFKIYKRSYLPKHEGRWGIIDSATGQLVDPKQTMAAAGLGVGAEVILVHLDEPHRHWTALEDKMTDENGMHHHQFRAGSDLMGQQMAAPGVAGSGSSYVAQELGNARTQVDVDNRSAPSRSWLDRWGGWLVLSAVAAVTAGTFVGAVVLGTASVAQYVVGWLGVALCVGIFGAASQAMH